MNMHTNDNKVAEDLEATASAVFGALEAMGVTDARFGLAAIAGVAASLIEMCPDKATALQMWDDLFKACLEMVQEAGQG